MNPLEGITRAIGWTVLHFLWQGSVIAAAVAVALGVLRKRDPRARYAACGVGLVLMLAAPLATLAALLTSGAPTAGVAPSPALQELATLAGWQRITPWLPWITLFWLTGFCLLQGRAFFCWTRALRLKHRHTLPLSPAWQARVDGLCDRVGVRRAVRVVRSTVAEVPMLIGWLSPVILVPTAAFCGLTREQLESVLAHELAHVRRHDALFNLLQATLEALLFFHPAVWWISDRMRIEREFCCDDVAVRACGDTLCYARALSNLEHLRAVPYPAVASNGGSLMNRISRLVGNRPSNMSGRWAGLTPALFAASLAALFAVAGITLAADVEPSGPEPGPEPSARHGAEPRASGDSEPAEVEHLRKRIARREADLEKLQRELAEQDPGALRELELRTERERMIARDLEAVERDAQRELRFKQEAMERNARDLAREAEAMERDVLARDRDAQRALRWQQETLERSQHDSLTAAEQELERALAIEYGARLRENDGAAEMKRALELERELERSADRSEPEVAELRAELDRLRTRRERSARAGDPDARRLLYEARERARERADRDDAPDFRFQGGDPASGSSPEELRRELLERQVAVEKLSRELELERRRMEAAMRDLERLESGRPE